MFLRKALVSLYQTICNILDVKTYDCCCKIQYNHFRYISLHINIFYKSPNPRNLNIDWL